MELIEQTWNGTSTSNGKCTATVSRNGDLVGRMYIDVKGTIATDTIRNPGSEFIKSVTVEIGGQQVDKHSGKYMETYAELTQPNTAGTTCVITATDTAVAGTNFQAMSGMGGVDGANVATDALYVPLQFWFCRNAGLALPLIALQYHEVKVILDHAIATTFATTVVHNKLWAEYIYLDTDERRRFAQVSHEYLIEQVQEQSLAAATGNHDLNFNHPVKELIWSAASAAEGSVAATALVKPCTALSDTLRLKLNGHDRFADQPMTYFSRTQVWQHHTGMGLNSAGAATSARNDSICVYSFALKPEEHQPSGTCNFSRIDNAQFVVSAAFPANTHVYAVNYNVLRIMSGMGGLAYSN